MIQKIQKTGVWLTTKNDEKNVKNPKKKQVMKN